jgi:ArsR family transcriptional regulator, arsenate/arsenite/antimonite-responsive transcriptional repressor
MEDGQLVRILKALADSKRFRMVQELAAAGELSCGQLGARFDLAQPTVSHHLKLLVEAGVLVARQQAQHHFISVNHALLDRVSELLPFRLGAALPRSFLAASRPRPAWAGARGAPRRVPDPRTTRRTR